jgi:uracil-DNA glycosylase
MDVLLHNGDVGGFRTSVLELLGQQVHPAAVAWSASGALSGHPADGGPAGHVTRLAASIVPRSFLRMLDLALLHSDPQRFDVLYRLLWRVVREPRLKDDRSDFDMQRAVNMAQAVGRELRHLKGCVVFQDVPSEGTTLACGWAAPHFYTTEAMALWLARSRPGTDFLFGTPERCILSRRGALRHLPPLAAPPRDAEEWLKVLAR